MPRRQDTPDPGMESEDSDRSEDEGDLRGDADRVIEVLGKRYEFTPGTDEPIIAERGEDLYLSFRSLDDGYHDGHGLAIDWYGIDLKAQEGKEDSTVFTADTAGEFEVRCSMYCGEGHPTMTGTFVVEEPNV